MYTIKQASVRSGVSVALLRQWERRYDVVRPARTGSGYRMYDDISIERLRLMRALVDDGWAPSMAADHIRRLADTELPQLPRDRRPPGRLPAAVGDEGDLAEAFVEAARSLEVGSIEAVLDDMFARGSFEQVVTRYLMPALRALGSAWSDGTVTVAAEHVASAAVLRRLSVSYQAAGRGGADRPVALVGLPPGARHELGAMTFAILARRAGINVVYLGADLPVAGWRRSAEQTAAAAAIIGVAVRVDVASAVEVAEALHKAFPRLFIAYGGGAVEDIPAEAVGTRLPDLMAATDLLLGLLDPRRPSRSPGVPRSG